MDELEMALRNVKVVPNPKYNPNAKRSKQPKTITAPIYNPNNRSNIISLGIKEGMDRYSVDAEKSDKWARSGLNWRPGRDMDTALSKAQSNWSKFFNAVGQTLYSEIFLGTIKAGSDLVSAIPKFGATLADEILSKAFDVKGDKVQRALGMDENDDYSNPVSRKIEEWQDYYKNEVAPIYTTPGVDIFNGGLSDFGWWMSNMPSIASSLTLLLPARGVSVGIGKLAGMAAKAAKASKVERAIAKAEKYKSLAEASKVTQAAKTEKELNAFQRMFYNPINQERLRTAGKVGSDAILMRTMENYQEAHQTYTDMYKDAAEYLEGMSGAEYNEFLKNNAEDLEAAGIDTNDRDAVAKRIAKRSADRTFLLDYSNTVFDVIQLYALRNIGKLPKKVKSASILSAQEESIEGVKQIGKATAKTATGKISGDAVKETAKGAEKAAEKTAEKAVTDAAKKTIGQNLVGKGKSLGKTVKNFATGTGKLVASEASEGVEEAINYIAQQEGITLGNTLLGKETDATASGFWNRRLTDYLENAELWESAFWGVMGGVVFGAAGSALNKRQFNFQALKNKKNREENKETGEKIDSPAFITLRDEPEVARAKAAINLRNTRLNDLQQALSVLEDGRDPRMPRQEDGKHPELVGDVEAQKDDIRKSLIAKYQTEMALEAINSGTFDLLVDYFRSDPVKQAMVDNGIIESENADEFINTTVSDLEDIRDMYNNELAHVNYQVTALNASNRTAGRIPLEYVQQIAKTNVENRVRIKNIDRDIQKLEQQAAKEVDFSGLSQTDQLNNRRTIRLAQLTEVYARLEADKKAVQEDKTLDEWRRAESIADIEDYQDGIIRAMKETYSDMGVYDGSGKLVKGADTKAHQMASILNAVRRAQRHVRLADGTYRQNMGKDVVVKTDEEIIKEYERYFEGNESETASLTQLSKAIHQQMLDTVSGPDSIYSQNSKLFDLYQNIGNLETTRAIYSRNINRTQAQIANKVDVLHNRGNKFRLELIDSAEKAIREIHDKYKDTNESDVERAIIKAFFNDKDEAERIAREHLTGTDETGKKDSEKLIDALKILNFSKGANRQVFQYISTIFKRNSEKYKTTGKNSTTSQNQASASEEPQTTNNPQPIQNASTEQANGQNGQQTQKTIVSNNKKVRIVVSNDGTITSITKQGGGVPIIEYSDGSIELNLSGTSKPTQRKYIFSELFEETGSAVLEDNVDWQILNNPTLTYDEERKQYVVNEKGDLQLVNKETGEVIGENAAPQTQEGVQEEGTPEGAPASEPVVEEGNPLIDNTNPIEDNGSVAPQAPISSTGDVAGTSSTNRSDEEKELIVQQTLQMYVDFNGPVDFEDVKAKAIQYLTEHNDGSFTDEEIPSLVEKLVGELQEAFAFIQETEDPLIAAAGNLTYQARYDEFDEVGFNFTQAFTKAVEAFINEYSKLALVPEVDGKKAVRIRDILRICNNLNPTHDTTIANQIHGIIHSYLTSDEGREKYHFIDEAESENGKVIADCVKTSEELSNEPEVERFLPQPVDIVSHVEQAQLMDNKAYKDALNSLKVGDTLRMVNVGKEFLFYKGNVVIGSMRIPQAVNGQYVIYNSGWRTDVAKGPNGEIVSNMRDVVMHIFTSDDADCKQIRELLIKAGINGLGNVSDDILDKFEKIPLIEKYIKESIDAYASDSGGNIFFVEEEYVDDVSNAPRTKQATGNYSVDVEKVFNQLLGLWNYTFSTLNENTLEGNKTMLEINTNKWFKKLFDEYELRSQQTADRDVEIVMISDGQLIKANNIEGNIDEQYKQCNLIKSATNDTSKIRIAVVNPRKDGEIFVSNPSAFPNGTAIDQKEGFSRATRCIAVYGRNKNVDYTNAFGVATNDRESCGTKGNPGESDLHMYARAGIGMLRSALVDYNNSVQSKASSQFLFDKIEDVLRSLFYTDSTKDRIPLFIQSKTGDKFFIHPARFNNPKIKGISLDYFSAEENKTHNLVILSHGNHGPMFGVSIDGKWTVATNNVNSQNQVLSLIENTVANWMFDHTRFNVSDKGIKSDSIHEDINKGFIKRQLVDGQSKIIIDMPTGKDSTQIHAEYDSYNDFVIENNLIKVNLTMDEDGNNFANRGDDILSNQVLKVNMPTNTSPVTNVPQSDVNMTPEQAAEQNHIDYILPSTDSTLLERIKRAVVLGNDKNFSRVSTNIRILLNHSKGSQFVNEVMNLASTLGLRIDDLFPERLHYYEDYNWYGTDTNGNPVELGMFATAVVGDGGKVTVDKFINGRRSRRDISSNMVLCGPRLLNMLASNSEQRKNRAIRILMHERLHQHFHAEGVDTNYVLSQLRGIYDETINALNARAKEARKHPLFKQGYRYNPQTGRVVDKNGDPASVSAEDLEALRNVAKLQHIRSLLRNLKDDVRLEEFAVEAMTNMTLIEFMNSVEATGVEAKKESIFSKFLKFITKLFGITINDNSLMEKYINTLSNLNLTNDTTEPVMDVNASGPDYIEGVDEPDNTSAPQTPQTETETNETPQIDEDLGTVSLEGTVNIDGIDINLDNTEISIDGFDNIDIDGTDINPDIDIYSSAFDEFVDNEHLKVPNLDFIKKNMPLEIQENVDTLINNGIIEYKCR